MAAPWILIAVIVLLILFLIIAVVAAKSKKKKQGPNYYAYFIIGLIWLPIGIIMLVTDNSPVFFILGLVFLAIGLVNKDKWDKKRGIYLIEDKFWRTVVIGLLLLFVVLGVVVLLITKKLN